MKTLVNYVNESMAYDDNFKPGDYIEISGYEVMRIDKFKHVPGDDGGTCIFTGPAVGYLAGDKIYEPNETIDVPAPRLERMIHKISKDEFKRKAARYISLGDFDITVDDLL